PRKEKRVQPALKVLIKLIITVHSGIVQMATQNYSESTDYSLISHQNNSLSHSQSLSSAHSPTTTSSSIIKKEVLKCFLQLCVLGFILFSSCPQLPILDAGKHLHILWQEAPSPLFKDPS